MSLAAIKYAARRAVHSALSVSALYRDEFTILPIPLKVRWHMKQQLVGQLDSGGYAETIEGIERIIFDMEELTAKGVELMRTGIVELTDLEYLQPDGNKPTFELEVQELDTGPIERIWKVTRQ